MERLKSFKSFRNRSINLAGEENAKELLEAQAHIWNHIFSFINSMSLKCAIQLGIPDVINAHGGAGEPMSLSQLAGALPINPAKTPCLYRLMRVLVHSGFFVSESGDGEARYGLTAASRLLLKDNPLSVTPFLLSMLDPVLTRPWDFLGEWFTGDEPTPFHTAHGKAFFEMGGQQAELGKFFNDAMASDARLVTSVVIERCRGVFEGAGSLVDVGGGTGTVARAIADAFPGIDCTVLDLPHVVAGLTGEANLKFVAGDMFETVPPADAILLKWILHDWSDEESVEILKKCKEAINDKKNGKVIIIDMMVENHGAKEDDESYETQLFFDMLMMVLVTGRERNEKEWAKLFQDAGFKSYKITPILGLRSLIEVYP